MVQLIKIDRLAPRIEGMLYKVKFEETWALLDEVRPNTNQQLLKLFLTA